jgi:HlyD family secretion protein
MDGVVSLLSVKKGERVVGNSMMAGTEMMRIADLSKIEVRVDVGENDIPKVHLGDSATIDIDAYYNRKFKGVVTQIASSNTGAATQTALNTGTEVTNYKVYIRLLPESYTDLIDPKRPKAFPFRPGMSGSADIKTKTHENRLAVPINAVTTRDKNDTTGSKTVTDNTKPSDNMTDANETSANTDDLEEVVFTVQKDHKVKKVNVRTDIQDINYIEVLGGLNEGEEVVTSPYNVVSKELKDGMLVKVVPKTELFEQKKK